MKKMTIMCMAALLMLAVSCKKEAETYSDKGFQATTESHTGDADNRTSLNGLDVTWSSGDAIKVFSGSDSKGKVFSTTDTSDEADFTPTGTVTDAFFTPPYTAIYPASAALGANQISLLETQHYTKNDDVLTFAPGENPMAAVSTTTELPFRNLCGILKFQLYSATSCTVKSLRVTSLKDGEQLWGTGTVTFDGQEADLGALSNGGASVVLDCGDGVALSNNGSQPTEFLVVIPGGALSEGFKLTVTDADGRVWSRTANTNNMITKSKIKAMPESPVVPADPVTPAVTIAEGCVNCTYTISGEVTVPSGTHTCEYGVVFCPTSAGHSPTVDDSKIVMKTESISGTKTFTIDINDALQDGETYYMRTYAIIEGLAYSSAEKTIVGGNVPQSLPSAWTNGKNPHPFTVGSGKVVYFSQGNLQYNATGSSATAESGTNVGGTWRFAEHQFDFVGDATMGNVYADDRKCDNSKVAQTYNDWIDLFGWGTSGYNHGANCYQPWSTSIEVKDYYVYSDYIYNLEDGPTSQMGKADWGKANIISNGGDNNWRTLTKDEWNSLINRKDSTGKLLYGEGRVGNCIPGLIILPDDWNCPDELTDVVRGESPWSNVYSYLQWSLMEKAGAIFLPAAGHRNGTKVYYVCEVGNYWSSSYYDDKDACRLLFGSNSVASNYNNGRYGGRSVRLVTEN